MDVISILASICAVFSVLAAAMLLRRGRGRRAVLKRRLSLVARRRDLTFSILRAELFSRNPRTNRWLNRLPLAGPLSRMIGQANLPFLLDRLLLIMVLVALCLVAIGFRLRLPWYVAVPMAAAGGFLLPYLYLLRRIQQRLRRFTLLFPDVLALMSSSLRAGHSLEAALEMVARESIDPIGSELSKTVGEISLGVSVKEALEHLSERLPSPDMKLFVTAVLVQREVGGNLVESLENIERTIRERIKVLGQVQVMTAQGRMTGWIIGLLPVALWVILTLLAPGHFTDFFQNALGRLFIAGALALQVIGVLWIRAIVHIRV